VEYVHVTLSQALGQATRDGLVGRNVAEAVDPPKVPRREMRALTPAEVDALLTTAEGDWRTLWMLALYTGIREGELLGLTWPDVDLERATVTVQRALVAGEDGVTLWVRPYPKSRAGIRIIPITAEVVAELRRHRARQVEERLRAAVWAETDRCVFLTTRGTPLNPSHVSRTLKRDALVAGITGNVHVHVLRHSYASSLLAAGRPIPEVAYLLGHSSPAITLTVYSHFVRGAGEDAATALRRFYAGG
jgi:integrase